MIDPEKYFEEDFLVVLKTLLVTFSDKNLSLKTKVKDFGYPENASIISGNLSFRKYWSYLDELVEQGFLKIGPIAIDSSYITDPLYRSFGKSYADYDGKFKEVIENEKSMSWKEFQDFIDDTLDRYPVILASNKSMQRNMPVFFEICLHYLNFDISITKSKHKDLSDILDRYTRLHMNQDIEYEGNQRIFSYQVHREEILNQILEQEKTYGKKQLVVEKMYMWKTHTSKRADLYSLFINQTKFLEAFLVLEMENIIRIRKMNRSTVCFDYIGKTLGANKKNVESKTTVESVRSDIDYLYRLDFRKNTDIYLNNILFRKTNFDSVPNAVISYLFENANKKVLREEIVEECKISTTRTLPDIIKDLGFSGNHKKTFFPNLSNTAVTFTPLITRDDLRGRGLDELVLTFDRVSSKIKTNEESPAPVARFS
ncbi:hypothetical protein HOE67_00685 [Candidatus Peregrinibacteria bacterium]|jgi:hypothetical protein|nr:hypothetical protein [Candidatus Peregrinibacteria bacterium]MBT4055605.1 hypothetical protein [Candidatus Peregrinibacteria bacterium]